MRNDPWFLLWAVRCPSPDESRRLQHWLSTEFTPETVLVEDVRAFPGGAEAVRRDHHRLGDSFAAVQVVPPADPGSTSFHLLFQRRPEAPREWKDLMVRVLQLLRGHSPQAVTTLEYRGDEAPFVLPTRP